MRVPLAALVLCTATFALPAGAATTDVTCSGTGSGVATGFSIDVGGGTSGGVYAWPAQPPTTLVMVAHGYGGTGAGYTSHVQSLAQAGALVVALDFRGAANEYKVFAGAEDTAAAVAHMRAECPSIDRVILWGVSMGGHISSLAIMQNPGLADFLVMDVGPTNIPQLLATGVPGAAVLGATNGVSESHQPLNPDPCGDPTAVSGANKCLAGYTIQQAVLAAYKGRETDLVPTSPALNPAAWAASGLGRAYLIYEAADTLVPPDQGSQLKATMASQGVPVSQYVVPFRGTFRTPDPANPGVHPHGINGLGLPDHQSAGREVALRLVLGTVSANPPAVVVGSYTPDTGDPLPTKALRTGNGAVDGPLGPAYQQADPHVANAQRSAGRFIPEL